MTKHKSSQCFSLRLYEEERQKSKDTGSKRMLHRALFRLFGMNFVYYSIALGCDEVILRYVLSINSFIDLLQVRF